MNPSHLDVSATNEMKMINRRLRGSWILYDIGSSGYALLITAVAFPLYFRTEIAGNAAWSDWLWGSLFALGSIIAGLIVPLVGAAADITQRGWFYLLFFTCLSALSTMALALPHIGVPGSSLLFLVSLVSYHVAAALYDSIVKFIAPSSHAWMSGLGWGLGYLGGLACYFVALSFLALAGSNASIASPITILMTGIYYGSLCGVALYGLSGYLPAGSGRAVKVWQRSLELASSRFRGGRSLDWRTRRVIASGLVTGSAVSVGMFSPLLFVSYFGLSAADVAKLGVIFSIVSIPATIAAGFMAKQCGGQRTLLGFLPLWIALVTLLWTGTGQFAATAAAILLGLALGPTQAIGRSVVAAVADQDEAFVKFGFAAFINRTTGALGPLFFGAMSSASGNRVLPLMVVATFMLAGFLLLAVTTAPRIRPPLRSVAN